MDDQELNQYLEQLAKPAPTTPAPTAPTPTAPAPQPEASVAKQDVDTEEDKLARYFTYADDIPAPTTPSTPPAPVETPAPTTPATSTLDDRIKLERELAAAQERLRMYEAAITSTSQQQQQEAPPATTSLYSPDELEIPKELQEVYKDATPYIDAIAKKNIAEAVKKTLTPIEEKLRATQAELEEYKRNSQSQRQNALHMQLKQVIPDLDDIAVSPEWQAFIRQPDAYGGTRTIAQHVQEGLQSGNVQVISAIVNMFKQAKGKSNPQPSQIAPGTAPQTAPVTNPTRDRVLSMAGYEKAVDDYDRGLISWDDFQKIQDVYLTQAITANMPNY